jgi:hypothetical protein
MVDLIDKVIVVWDEMCGGTVNCARYAQNVGKEIIRLPV